MRRTLRATGMLILIAAMAAAIGWQARGVVTYWRGTPRETSGWGSFMSGDRHFGCSWWVTRAVVFREGQPARMYDVRVPRFSRGLVPEADELTAARSDPAARIIEVDARYIEREYGRLRTTAIQRESVVAVRLLKGETPLTRTEHNAALRLLYDDPIPITSGSEVDHLGGVIFERYLNNPTMAYLWWPLLLSVGQVLLAPAMVVAMLWLTRQVARELRGESRALRRERGLCLSCGYPVGGAVCPECGAATGR